MTVLEYLRSNRILLDGGMGTLLQERGLAPGEAPERWNISHSDLIEEIHLAYYDAGSNVVNTNTFGANALHFSHRELEEIINAAVANVRRAAERSSARGEKFVALDIGPTGRLLRPYGDLDFEETVAIFAEVVRLGVAAGVDLITIETMNDSYETKAALLAAKENSTLPVFVTNAYGSDGKLMTGAEPEAMVALLEGMRADAIGINCSLGPESMRPTVERLLAAASVPVIVKPNAGLPRVEAGKTVYDVSPLDFAREMKALAEKGALILGGCCGTTPAHIRALAEATEQLLYIPVKDKQRTVVSSYTHAVTFSDSPVLIGERINPTGKKRLKEALLAKDMDYLLKEGFGQAESGAMILDVNVGLPGIDEPQMLTNAVCELQAVLDLPLQIDSSDSGAMEAALRRYNGKAMINSVSGKEESLHTILPLVKKYGGLLVALTLDDGGIPATVEGRVAIAKRILAVAKTYGIEKKDIVFDTLAMTVSTDPNAAKVTVGALERIRRELGCHTSLGVSNVSFGLPMREAVNATFFAMALEHGLSAAILNPYSVTMMKTYYAHRLLHGADPNCADYIDFASRCPTESVSTVATAAEAVTVATEGLQEAVVKGQRELAGRLTAELLRTRDGMELVQNEIIPALDRVGIGFENKTVYLPQLLMSAEAAKAAFEVIKTGIRTATADGSAPRIILATVKGDIHDIGKNIVRLLLENYGFAVTDLGRDVPTQAVLDAVRESGAGIVGLSALMTTTVPAMEETLRALHEEFPACRVMVGGAVLNEEYARAIGADAYCKDAMAAVRCAEAWTKPE